MPFAEITLAPGVNVETSPADNPAGVQESNFIRWRANLPEKRGGCTLYIGEQISGVPCDLKPWSSFQGNSLLAIATDQLIKVYNSADLSLIDISPRYVDVPATQPFFTTVSGSSEVEISDPLSPDLTTYDSVQFKTPVSIGGLILNGTYPVIKTQGVGSHVYTIDAGYPANQDIVSAQAELPIFTTFAQNAEVQVNFKTQYQFNSLVAGNSFGLQIPITLGGITLDGQYIVTRILQADFFTFNANNAASYQETKTLNDGFLYLVYWKTPYPNLPTGVSPMVFLKSAAASWGTPPCGS